MQTLIYQMLMTAFIGKNRVQTVHYKFQDPGSDGPDPDQKKKKKNETGSDAAAKIGSGFVTREKNNLDQKVIKSLK